MADERITRDFDPARAGAELHEFVRELLPIPRSITGDGVRETLRRIGQRIPVEVSEFPTGTPVLDWTVPKEWNVREAWIKDAAGNRVLDFADHPLHLVGYSVPVRTRLSREELEPHLHSLSEAPDRIPYVTSYYRERWGFCLEHRRRAQLGPGPFEVCINTTLEDGNFSYGECIVPGATQEEVLISSHICHPGMCNDNLSGVVVATGLAQRLRAASLRHTYRFLFAPGTIGAITWLARNESQLGRIRHGMVLTGVGDSGGFTWKRTRAGDAVIDRAVEYRLNDARGPYETRDFSPYGYDERQFNSPGFKLPVGCLMRTPHGEYSEYHTSADNLQFVNGERLGESLDLMLHIVELLEANRVFRNCKPKGEPRLGRYGLFSSVGGRVAAAQHEMALLWVLNQSDGSHDLLSIAQRSGFPFGAIHEAATALEDCGLVKAENSATAGPRQV